MGLFDKSFGKKEELQREERIETHNEKSYQKDIHIKQIIDMAMNKQPIETNNIVAHRHLFEYAKKVVPTISSAEISPAGRMFIDKDLSPERELEAVGGLLFAANEI